MIRRLIPLIALIPFLLAASPTLQIANQTGQEILNILIQAKDPAREFFLRMDLLPESSDTVENPECISDLRVDTGLQFWYFQNIDLAAATKASFCGEHPVCIQLFFAGRKPIHYSGRAVNLTPEAGETPLCELDSFHPAMPMNDVCSHLETNMPQDDNGALITGLAFAGLPWSARLVASGTNDINADSLLEHLELRRDLRQTDPALLYQYLYMRGYVPWQAEFPGKDMELANDPATRSEKIILSATKDFLKSHAASGHSNHAMGEKCAEASILFAPASMLPVLENADEPASDVQLFTLRLRPCTNVLLLDVAAYRKQEPSTSLR